MHYTLVHPLTNKSIFYRLDVINDGFLVTCKYRGKNIMATYNNYSNIYITIDDVDISHIITTQSYNFNDVNEIFNAVDNIMYEKQLKLKTLYLMKYLSKITHEDMTYLIGYLY